MFKIFVSNSWPVSFESALIFFRVRKEGRSLPLSVLHYSFALFLSLSIMCVYLSIIFNLEPLLPSLPTALHSKVHSWHLFDGCVSDVDFGGL